MVHLQHSLSKKCAWKMQGLYIAKIVCTCIVSASGCHAWQQLSASTALLDTLWTNHRLHVRAAFPMPKPELLHQSEPS